MSDTATKAVSEVSKNFGIIIAFLLPGFIALWPLQHRSPAVQRWFQGAGLNEGATAAPSAGSFLFVVLASLAAGMVLSAVRWAVFDRPLHWGIERPQLDYTNLGTNLSAVDYINENHYKYYQYYSNSAVALVFWAVIQATSVELTGRMLLGYGAAIVLLELVLLAAARDALRKNVQKLTDLLGTKPERLP